MKLVSRGKKAITQLTDPALRPWSVVKIYYENSCRGKINSSESFTLTNLRFDSKNRLLLTENRDKKDTRARSRLDLLTYMRAPTL